MRRAAGIGLAALGVLSAALTVRTSRHADTSWIPVQLRLDADRATAVTVSWGPDADQRIPLVRGGVPDGVERRTVEITATGRHHPAATGSEVWLLQLIDDADRMVRWRELQLSPEWRILSSPYYGGGQPGTVRWQGDTAGRLRIAFDALPSGGIVELAIDGERQTLDLYSPSKRTVVVESAPGRHQSWVGLLPPVPIERLAPTVSGARGLVIGDLTLDTRATLGRETRLAGAAFTRVEGPGPAEDASMETTRPLGINAPVQEPGRLLVLWSIPIFLVVLALGIVGRAFRPDVPDGGPPLRRTASGSRAVLAGAALVAALYAVHTQTVPATYSGGDSNAFLYKGISLAERGTYDTGGYQFELNKLPGYPVLYALVIRTVGYRLSALVAVQHFLAWAAYLALGLALLRYVPPVFAVVAMVAAALSPVQLYYCSTLLSESMMVAFSVGALACLFELYGSHGRREWIFLLGFAVCTAVASMSRINAVFLALGLVLVYLPRLVGRSTTIGALAARAVVASLIVVAPAVGWSARNYVARGIFAPQDMRGVLGLQGALVSGAFDPRVPAVTPYYADFSRIVARRANLAWPLRSVLYARADPSAAGQRAAVKAVDDALLDVRRQSIAAHPWVYLAGVQRSLVDAVWLPDEIDAVNARRNEPHVYGYADVAQARRIAEEVKISSPRNRYRVLRNRGWWFAAFSAWNAVHASYYRVAMLAAALSAACLCFSARLPAVLLAPMALVLANVFFTGAASMAYGRYLQVLDFALVTQAVVALALRGALTGAREDRSVVPGMAPRVESSGLVREIA